MSDTARFEIGSPVMSRDGHCGELRRLVIDPVAEAITHLAVAPRHDHGKGRLVPVDLVASVGEEIELRCSMAEFEALDPALDAELLPGASQDWANQQDRIIDTAYYGLDVLPGELLGGGQSPGTRTRIFDRVPAGEVDVCPGDQVVAMDGAIGRVSGLVFDQTDDHVTHVLLEEGHLWGKKEVAIPIGAVERIDDGVRVKLTKEQVGDLPPLGLHDPD